MQRKGDGRLIRVGGIAVCCFLATSLLAQGQIPSTLVPASTSAHQIFGLSIFVISITSGIFVLVGGLLTLALIKFRARKSDRRQSQLRSMAVLRSNWPGLWFPY
jgi:cytochrome c oxidase subunit 2